MDIWTTLDTLSVEERRAALYYAARYIKQADNFDKYAKDIFEDVRRSAPPAHVKEAVHELLKALEEREGRPAANFSGETVTRILIEITRREAELSSGLSSGELDRGAALAASLEAPEPKKQ